MLEREDLDPDPVALFRRWFEEAARAGVEEPNAMTLATADRQGRPSARTVLLKAFDAHGFVFATNYRSRKGLELEANPRAALVFLWKPLERQVRIEGRVERCAEGESDLIFAGRPRGAQLGAWASRQSVVIAGRDELVHRLREVERRFPDNVARPEFWGGYRLAAEAIEFWQGRDHRLHDRFRYLREAGRWRIDRLAP